MTHHMALHNDDLGRRHTILKQDDYFRTLEEFPVIDGLHAYVMQRRGRLAPRQPLSVCTLLPTPRREQASTASWKPRPPFEAAEMD